MDWHERAPVIGIIDGSAELVGQMRMALELEGYRVVTSADTPLHGAAAAGYLCARHGPALLIWSVRAEPGTDSPPGPPDGERVLLASPGVSDEWPCPTAVAAGGRLLPLPLDIDQFVQRVDQALRGQKQPITVSPAHSRPTATRY